MIEYLDAIGPLRNAPDVAPGSRVLCWAGNGTVDHISPAFNGVSGIRVYAGVTLDNGNQCAAALDELELISDPAPVGPVVEGMLF